MKTSTALAIGILASCPILANAQTDQRDLLVLDAAQMDNVTAGMLQLPSPYASVSALANAIGRNSMTGTRTNVLVRGQRTPGQFGFGSNWVIASNALATATGDTSRSTSTSSSDDENGTTRLGHQINRTVSVGPTQISARSSVQPTGVLTFNLLQRTRGSLLQR